MSPIHDQSYRRYQGQRAPVGQAWQVILWTGIRSLLGKRTVIGLLLAIWIVFTVYAVNIYRVVMFPQTSAFWPVDAKFFKQFIEAQGFASIFITIYAGAGLIASDRRANALQIYLSKPLLRVEYIAGKLGILVLFLLQATLLPALLLLLMQVVLSGSLAFVRDNLFIIPAIVLACLIRVFVASFTILALSALSKSTRYVAILYVGVIFFSEAVYGILALVTGSTRVAWVSVLGNFNVLTDAIFRQPPRYDTPVIVSLLVLLALIVVSISVLERRVKGVEVVS